MLDVWNRVKQTGNGWYWVAPRLRAGDVFHLCSFAAEFKEVHGDAPIFLVVSSQHQANMAAAFDDHFAEVIVEPSMSATDWKTLSLQADLPAFAMNSPLLVDPWANRRIEPEAVHFFSENGFLWTQFYKNLLQISLVAEPTAPAVRPDRVEQARALCEAAGMRQGRSVLLFPYAQTFGADAGRHFERLAEVLSSDHDVYTSVAGDERPIPGAPPVSIPFALLQDVAEYAGWAVVLRSGIADILASARCRKSIVYRDLNAVQGWSLLQLDLARDASEFAFPFGVHSPDQFVETVLSAPTARDVVFRAKGLPERTGGRQVSLNELGTETPAPGETLVVRDIPYRGHPRNLATDRLGPLLEAARQGLRLYACRDSVLIDHGQGSFPFWEEIDAEMLVRGRYDAARYWHNIAVSPGVLEPSLPLSALSDGYLDLADPMAAEARACSSIQAAPFGYKGVALMRGWHPAEVWGVWGQGPHSRMRLVFLNAPEDGFVLTMGLNLVLSERHPEVALVISANGIPVARHVATLDNPRDFETFVPSEVVRGRHLDIDTRIENYLSPQAQDLTGDPRNLGIGLRVLKVEPPRPLRNEPVWAFGSPEPAPASASAPAEAHGGPTRYVPDSAGSEAGRRVCACILMNHPYPDNLPVLRRIYQGRFSHVVFLIPFLELPDEDVITVYRGPYFHAGFLTDARERLAEIDCDYFMILHDDILLNPRIDEISFSEYFPLGPDDGFFPIVRSLPKRLRDWSWYAGMAPRLLHPKSFLFGSGVELETLARHLPNPELVRRGAASAGVDPLEQVSLKGEGGHDLTEGASRFLLYGLGRAPLDGPGQAAVKEDSVAAIDHLLSAMDGAADMGLPPEADAGLGQGAQLPFPLVNGDVFTDFYIVPKSRMAKYAHYIGVASAANLWTEVMAPSILYSVCERVWSAEQLGLSLEPYNRDASILRMLDPRSLMTHPFKLSTVRSEGARGQLYNWMDAIRNHGAAADLGPISFGTTAGLANAWSQGWHGEEVWGRWSAQTTATVGLWGPMERRFNQVRVRLQAPVGPTLDRFSGSLQVNDGPEQAVSISWSGPIILDVLLSGEEMRPGEMNRIIVRSDKMIRPCDLDSASGDQREIGFGVCEVELL